MLDVLTVGNAILDAFLDIAGEDKYCSLDREKNELRVKYGEKILLDGCDFHLGGNACNVAVGLSRLGFDVGLMAELADDEFSEKLINGLKKEQVSLDLVQRHSGQSSFTIGLNFQGERTLFTEHRERAHDFRFDQVNAKWLYLTSLGNVWEHVYERVAEFKKTSGIKLASNPGTVQLLAGSDKFSYLFPLLDILFLSKTEAEDVVGEKGEIEVLLQKLHEMGSKIVCLTDGKKGAYAIDENGKVYRQEKLPATVVETTGAGDSFSTGFLGATLLGKDIQESLLWGVANAASVIEYVGSQPGLLTKEQMMERINK